MIVEFAILGGVAVLTVLAVVQLAVFLFQRNVVVTAVAEGARVGATFGRGTGEAREATCELIRQVIGERCDVLRVRAVERDGLVVVTADGTLPALAPGLPALRIHHTATMHDEEGLYPGLVSRTAEGRTAGSRPMLARTALRQKRPPLVAVPVAAGLRSGARSAR